MDWSIVGALRIILKMKVDLDVKTGALLKQMAAAAASAPVPFPKIMVALLMTMKIMIHLGAASKPHWYLF